MPISKTKLSRLWRMVQVGILLIATVLLIATIGLIVLEKTWRKTTGPLGPKDAFFNGTIGTELLPLPVLQVLPSLFPEHFGEGDQWISRFGFYKASPNDVLPIGFVASNHRPQSGAPSPVKFVGFTCALCHSTSIIEAGTNNRIFIPGTGNTSLNLFAWLDSLQAAALDEQKLTPQTIAEAYAKVNHRSLTFQERAMIGLWLRQFRNTLKEGVKKYDEPFGGEQSFQPEHVPTGPVRTQPFRTIVRRVLDRPATTMAVYTKIATVYQEQLKEWSQFDGSIRDLNVRSAVAAFAAGATVDVLATPEVEHNIKQASEYTRTLSGPSYSEVFPNHPLDQQKIERGKKVYMEVGPEWTANGKTLKLTCNACHGHPESGKWVRGELQGEIAPLDQIKTDPERVTYRYYDRLSDKLYAFFPDGHPFKFKREDLRPGPAGNIAGYINAPIDSAFSRAPFLHNASVLTLAELIGLKPRRNVFYRGANAYDPLDVGLESPTQSDSIHYFKLDCSKPGNSNQGHDFPWPYDSSQRNAQDLTSLLEFLKTL
jgi:hypothetical protein